MMIRQVTSVNWAFIGDAVPAFITIAMMPFTYSVAYGLIAYVSPLPYFSPLKRSYFISFHYHRIDQN